MSHGERAAFNPQHREWWGRRYFSTHSLSRRWNWWWKRATHKRERRDARTAIQSEAVL